MEQCTYWVVFCTPRPGTEERINLGIIVKGERSSLAEFGLNAKALRYLAPALEQHVRIVTQDVLKDVRYSNQGVSPSATYGISYLNSITDGPGVINLSAEQKIDMNPEDALALLTGLYLVPEIPVEAASTHREHLYGMDAVLRHTRSTLKLVIKHVASHSHLKVVAKEQATLPGLDKVQYFHFGIKNGTLKSAGFAIDMNIDKGDLVRRNLDAFAKAVEEVHKVSPEFPLLVVASCNRNDRAELWERADSYFKGSAALVQPDQQLQEWAEETIPGLATSALV